MPTPARIADAPPEQQHYTVEEAARRLRVCRATLYKLIASGELKSFKVRRKRFVSEIACRDMVARAEKKAS
jgi:excisionase family DNA binding protein